MKGAGLVKVEDFLAVYEQALKCYKQGDCDTAWQMITEFEQEQGTQVLLGGLLKAYILRTQKKYVSEISLLEDLVRDFMDSEDKKRLADAYSLLGAAYRMLGQSEAAVAAFVRSAQLEPSTGRQLTEISNALFAANAIEDLPAAKMQELYAQYRRDLQEMAVPAYPKPAWHHSKIRVGYLSADLRDHAVGQFVRPFFFHYNPADFEVFVYQLNKDSDFVTEDLRSAPVHWRNLAGAEFAEIARVIREDEIDILVELGGHTAGNALPVFAYRPAAVQLSGIGYFNSTGIYECDGFLSDIYCAPEEISPYFTEKLLRLPHTHFCYQPYKTFPKVSPPPCLQNGYITFGSFNNFAKVNDGMLRLWREILLRVTNSRLILKHQLLGTEEGRAYTLNRLKKL
jgi:predicted O-linked N-acetylglucosamine transferase (SPINDLY family)